MDAREVLVRLDLEIEWFERLIEEDGARGCDVDTYRSLLHKLRQVRGDIPSMPPSRAEMNRFFADALKESNHDLLRKQRDEAVADAYVLALAYRDGTRLRDDVVQRSLARRRGLTDRGGR